MGKYKTQKQQRQFLIIVYICLIIICGVKIGTYVLESIKQKNTYDEIAEEIVRENVYGEVIIDTDKIEIFKEAGSSLSSWIRIPDTVIDYPLVQASDNDFYLNRDAYGNEALGGAIFMDYCNNPDMTDQKTIIYGHNMKNGSMFHELHSYLDYDFAQEHKTLEIYTEDGICIKYGLLCCATVNAYNEDVYLIYVEEDIEGILNSINPYYQNEYNGNEIVVLSTCQNGDNRTIVIFQKESPADM